MLKKSITKKFMFLYIAVAVFSLSLIGFYSYYKAKSALVSRAIEQLNSVKSIKKEQIESYLNYCQLNKDTINESLINKILLDTEHTKGLGKSGEVYLVGNDYQLKSKSRFFPDRNLPVYAQTQSVLKAFESGEGYTVNKDYRGILCLSSYDRIDNHDVNWVIIAEIDYDEAMTPIANLRDDMIFISAIIVLLIFSIAQVITSDIVIPIRKLKESALKIGEGNFDAKVDIKSENEFGLLAVSFNQMIDDIQKNTAALVDERTKRITALIDGQEFERNRIARDLHDSLAQQLIAVKMTLENMINHQELNQKDKIGQLKTLINSSIDELRRISYDLSPSGILQFPIANAITNLINQIGESTGLQIDFSAFGDFSDLDDRTKIYLYRIVQEAITNTIKHAGASLLQIQLTETNSSIILMIEDNGKGFDFNVNHIGLGKGLFNMRERSMLLNGSFDIETLPDKGATIRVKINKDQHEWKQ